MPLPVINCICPEQQKTFFELFTAPFIITLTGTVIGVIFGGYITYLFGLRLAEKKEFRTIGSNLRRAFTDELLRLEAREDIDTYKILAPALNKHQAAVFEFRHVVAPDKQTAFDKAWKEYYYGTDELEIPFLEQYADNGSLTKREKYRQLALERIHKILSFEKQNK